MRSISILSLAAATTCAALVASSAAEAGSMRRVGVAPHAFARPAVNAGFVRPAYRPAAVGYHRYARHGWRNRGLGFAAGAAVGAAVGYGVAGGYDSGYAYAAPAASVDYAEPSYGYAAAPVTRSWQRSYMVPQTVVRPVTTTHLEPVTTYRAVQSTSYVPATVYRKVTQTCSCTTDGVTREVPCAGGYGTTGITYGGGVAYNRPGLFTSGW